MGLSIEVGYLTDLLENDREAAQWFQDQLTSLNEHLASEHLQPHNEPEKCEIFSLDMFGYSGLHFLRRAAAYIELRNELPPVVTDYSPTSDSDPVVKEYNNSFLSKQGFFEKLLNKKKTQKHLSFNHLIHHSDCEGYYIPQDFDSVLFPPENLKIAGCMIGSSHQLKNECERLAKELNLPLGLDPEAEELLDAADSQGDGKQTWQKYGIESFTCLRLYCAANHSVETGAALVFC